MIAGVPGGSPATAGAAPPPRPRRAGGSPRRHRGGRRPHGVEAGQHVAPRPRPVGVVGAHQGQPSRGPAHGHRRGAPLPRRGHQGPGADLGPAAHDRQLHVALPGRRRRCATRRRHGAPPRPGRPGPPAPAARRAIARPGPARRRAPRSPSARGRGRSGPTTGGRSRAAPPSARRGGSWCPTGPSRSRGTRRAAPPGRRAPTSWCRRARGWRTATTRRCPAVSPGLGLASSFQCSKCEPSRALAWIATMRRLQAAVLARAR